MARSAPLLSAWAILALNLAACASAPIPPLADTHPASPRAAAAPSRHVDTLRPDEATRATRELLDTAAPPTASPSPSAMRGMHH